MNLELADLPSNLIMGDNFKKTCLEFIDKKNKLLYKLQEKPFEEALKRFLQVKNDELIQQHKKIINDINEKHKQKLMIMNEREKIKLKEIQNEYDQVIKNTEGKLREIDSVIENSNIITGPESKNQMLVLAQSVIIFTGIQIVSMFLIKKLFY